MAWVDRLRTVAIEHGGPVISAVALGLISAPIVALSAFDRPTADSYMSTGWQPMEAGAGLLLAACAVIPASVIGGSVGGEYVRHRPATAVLAALALAWPIAITLLPLAASVLHIRMAAAIVCIDACTAELTSVDPGSGLGAYFRSLFLGGSIGGAGIVAGIVGAVGWTQTRRGPASGRVAVAVVTYTSLHLWSVMYGWESYACLVVGTLIWVAWLRWRASQLQPVEASDDAGDGRRRAGRPSCDPQTRC